MRRLLPLVACLLFAGCGGSGDGPRLSAAEYRARANAACARVDDELLRLPIRARGKPVDELARRGREISGRFIDAIAALRPPKDVEDAHAGLVKHLRAFRKEADADARALPEPDAAQRRNGVLRGDFKALGLKRCLATVRG